MGDRTATVIIEPRSLMREALVSLMESHSYHVVCSVGSAPDIDPGALNIQPRLVILSGLSADRAAEALRSIRSRWHGAKMIMLFEKVTSIDLQKLLASGLDACIPMFASPCTLIDTLRLIVCEDLRVLMLSDSAILAPSIDSQTDVEDGSQLEGRPRVASLVPAQEVSACGVPGARHVLAKTPLDGAARGGGVHGLSEREEQILKSLVQGHSNKVIARMCTVTEATVKVHMKSILRKIRATNRTQAAIWALQNAHFAHDMNATTRATSA
jgi:two-component system nitrate/nitrite response regulator NarL